MKKTTLKQELKKSFPNVKFSVRKSGGTFTDYLVVTFKQTAEATYDSVMKIAYKFEKQELPFYICRKNKKSCLYIKTNNGWFKSSETEVDDLLLKFCNKAVSSVGMAISNTYDIFKKMPSKYGEIFEINKEDKSACNFDEWQLHHKTEIISNLFVFKEDYEVAVKKLKHLMCKFGSISTDTDNSEEE